MLKAGALVYAIVFSIIAALMVAGLFYLQQFQYRIITNSIQSSKLLSDVRSAINYNLASQVMYNGKLDLYGDSTSTVTMKSYSWGAFMVTDALATWRYVSVRKILLSGYDYRDQFPYALYLTDHDNFLSLSGKTELLGICCIPKAIIKQGYVNGDFFYGTIPSKVVASKSDIQPVSGNLTNEANRLLNNGLLQGDSVVIASTILKGISSTQSFSANTLVYQSSGGLVLKDCILSGHIMVRDKKSITIAADNQLNNIILVAPSIHVQSGFKGKIQLIASDTIIVQPDVALDYPSFAAVFAKPKGTVNSYLEIGKNSIISGGLLLQCNPGQERNGHLTLGENVRIMGLIYSDDFACLRGKITGQVICSKLMIQTYSTFYENYLYNTTIDVISLPEWFAAPGILKLLSIKNKSKWLN